MTAAAALSSDSSCHRAESSDHGADAFKMVESSLGDMMEEIHKELRSDIVLDTEMGTLLGSSTFLKRINNCFNLGIILMVEARL